MASLRGKEITLDGRRLECERQGVGNDPIVQHQLIFLNLQTHLALFSSFLHAIVQNVFLSKIRISFWMRLFLKFMVLFDTISNDIYNISVVTTKHDGYLRAGSWKDFIRKDD